MGANILDSSEVTLKCLKLLNFLQSEYVSYEEECSHFSETPGQPQNKALPIQATQPRLAAEITAVKPKTRVPAQHPQSTSPSPQIPAVYTSQSPSLDVLLLKS